MALITSAVIYAAATVYSAVQQRKAAKAQRRSIKAQQRMADLAAARERRSAIRNARVQQASIESQAANTGLVGSTAAAGASGNVTSRTNENLSFMDMTNYQAQQASKANEDAAKYQSRAATGEAIGKLASGVGGIYG